MDKKYEAISAAVISHPECPGMFIAFTFWGGQNITAPKTPEDIITCSPPLSLEEAKDYAKGAIKFLMNEYKDNIKSISEYEE